MTQDRQQETLEPLRRRSPGHALIESVLRFWLGEGITSEFVFIEKDSSEVASLPLRRTRAGAILGGVTGAPM